MNNKYSIDFGSYFDKAPVVEEQPKQTGIVAPRTKDIKAPTDDGYKPDAFVSDYMKILAEYAGGEDKARELLGRTASTYDPMSTLDKFGEPFDMAQAAQDDAFKWSAARDAAGITQSRTTDYAGNPPADPNWIDRQAIVRDDMGGVAMDQPDPIEIIGEQPPKIRPVGREDMLKGAGLASPMGGSNRGSVRPAEEETPDISTSVEEAVAEALGGTEEATTGEGLMARPKNVYATEGPEAAMSAPSITLANLKEPVSKGSKGNTVEQLQNKLLDIGYDVGRGGTKGLRKDKTGNWSSLDNSERRGVDGSFGPGVEGAVKAFQEDAGLPVTGVVDKATAAKLASAQEIQFKELDKSTLSDKQVTHYDAVLQEAQKQGLSGVELASFMAQAGHESDSFNTLTEYASGAAYEGRKDLGNTQKGDGKRYKGRGHIQLTGRANYKKAGDALGLDLVGNPDLVASDPNVGAKVSLWFWNNNVRKQAPDFSDVERVTKVVNGGFNGLKHRKELFDQMSKAWNENS